MGVRCWVFKSPYIPHAWIAVTLYAPGVRVASATGGKFANFPWNPTNRVAYCLQWIISRLGGPHFAGTAPGGTSKKTLPRRPQPALAVARSHPFAGRAGPVTPYSCRPVRVDHRRFPVKNPSGP